MTLVTGPGQGNAKCHLEKILRRRGMEYERGEGDYIKEDEDERWEHVREVERVQEEDER